MKPQKVAPLLALVALLGCDDSASAPALVPFSVPKNPYLADSTWPIFHRDTYAQHSSELPAPTGRHAITMDTVALPGLPIFVLFDPAGDILVVVKGLGISRLCKVRRATLENVACVDLSNGQTFGGAYGYVDAQGRAVIGTGNSLQRWRSTETTLELDASVDLSTALGSMETLAAVTVRYTGEIAFAGTDGTVGIVPADLAGPPIDVVHNPGETISNGITTDVDGGIYVVSDPYLRRYDLVAGKLVEGWKIPVEASSTTPRPGRLGTGSGTTPSLIMDDRITITDDAESMNLMVARRGLDAPGERTVCKVPVFDGPATTDNAIVVSGTTLIVEQNLTGYGGVARFDPRDDGTCQRTWVSPVVGPSCVPTLSTATNLVYVYTYDESTDEWGLTGLDLRTGRTRFHFVAGSGFSFDNLYAAVTIGPDRKIYLGTIGGLRVFSEAP